MALTITTNFNGAVADVIYKDLAEGTEVIAGNRWHKGSIARLIQNVPDKMELRAATQAANPIGAYVETPVAGDVTVTHAIGKRELNLEKMMIYLEFNPEDYDFEWADLRSIGSQTEHFLNPTLINNIIEMLAPNAGAQLAANFFMGDKIAGSAGLTRFNGIFTKAIADANTVQVLPAVAITAGNIISILGTIIDTIPDKDYGNENYKILMSLADFRILQRVNTDTKKTSDGVLDDRMKNMIEEKIIVPYVGIAKDHILATKTGAGMDSNLAFGFWFDPAREMSDVRIGRVAENSDNWFLRINMKADANYVYSENLIYYVPA